MTATIDPDLGRCWIFEWDSGVDDSSQLQRVLDSLFGRYSGTPSRAWICVLDRDCGPWGEKLWRAWVSLENQKSIGNMRALVKEHAAITPSDMVPVIQRETLPGLGGDIPIDIIIECVAMQPYVQHGVAIDWHAIGKASTTPR